MNKKQMDLIVIIIVIAAHIAGIENLLQQWWVNFLIFVAVLAITGALIHKYIFRRKFREHPVLGAVLVWVVAGPLIAAGYTYFTHWWQMRDRHPMFYVTGPSYLSVLVVGGVIGLCLGIVCGYLYKHYASKP